MATSPIDIACWVKNSGGTWVRIHPATKHNNFWDDELDTMQTNVSSVWNFVYCNAANGIYNPASITINSFDFSSPFDVGVGYKYLTNGQTQFYDIPTTPSFTATTAWLKYDTTFWTYRITWTVQGSHNLDTVPADLTDVLLGAINYQFSTDRFVQGQENGVFAVSIIDNDAPGPAPSIASYTLTLNAEAEDFK